MTQEQLIPIDILCQTFEVEFSFFNQLNDLGLIEIISIKSSDYIRQDTVVTLEKMMRIHNDLEVNIESLDVVFNLLEKIDSLQNELTAVKNRLGLYE